MDDIQVEYQLIIRMEITKTCFNGEEGQADSSRPPKKEKKNMSLSDVWIFVR